MYPSAHSTLFTRLGLAGAAGFLLTCAEPSSIVPRPNCAGENVLLGVETCPDGVAHRPVYCVDGRRRTGACGMDEWPEEAEFAQACGLDRSGVRRVRCLYHRWTPEDGWTLCAAQGDRGPDGLEGCVIRCMPEPCQGVARCRVGESRLALCRSEAGVKRRICRGEPPGWEDDGPCRDFFEAGEQACPDVPSCAPSDWSVTVDWAEDLLGPPEMRADCTHGRSHERDAASLTCVHGEWVDTAHADCAPGTIRPVSWCEGMGWERCVEERGRGVWAGEGICLAPWGVCASGEARFSACALGSSAGGLRRDRCVDGRWIEGPCLPKCLDGSDCVVGECQPMDVGRVCLPVGCENGVRDGDEDEVDCGGRCDPCPDREPAVSTCRSACSAEGVADDE